VFQALRAKRYRRQEAADVTPLPGEEKKGGRKDKPERRREKFFGIFYYRLKIEKIFSQIKTRE
jgi:hypothetical protein